MIGCPHEKQILWVMGLLLLLGSLLAAKKPPSQTQQICGGSVCLSDIYWQVSGGERIRGRLHNGTAVALVSGSLTFTLTSKGVIRDSAIAILPASIPRGSDWDFSAEITCNYCQMTDTVEMFFTGRTDTGEVKSGMDTVTFIAIYAPTGIFGHR